MNSTEDTLSTMYFFNKIFTSSGLFIGPDGSVVEVLEAPSLTSTCNPPSIPESNLAPILLKQDLGITVCGGSFTANCWVLAPSGWIQSQAMGEARAHAASVKLGDNWWASGNVCECYAM